MMTPAGSNLLAIAAAARFLLFRDPPTTTDPED